MRRAADALLAAGTRAVLVKGGHLDDGVPESPDLFADGTRAEWLARRERIDTPHTHGTGCTLSAAIAAYLARGADLLEAVRGGQGVRDRGDPPRAAPGRGDRTGRSALADPARRARVRQREELGERALPVSAGCA